MEGASNQRPRIVLHTRSLPKKWHPSLELGIFFSSQNMSVAVCHHACLVADLRKGKFSYTCVLENRRGVAWVSLELPHLFTCSSSQCCLLALCRHLIIIPCALRGVISFQRRVGGIRILWWRCGASGRIARKSLFFVL